MPSWFSTRLLLLCLFLSCVIPAWAAKAFDVATAPLTGDYLAPGMALLVEEPGQPLGLDEVRSAALAARFVPITQPRPLYGWSETPLWLRLPVANSGKKNIRWTLELAYAYVGEVDLFVPDGHGVYQQRRAGAALPFAEREANYQHPAFFLDEPPGERVYYLRLVSGNRLLLAFRAWNEGTLPGDVAGQNLFLGIHFGVLLALMAYNFFLYLSVRDKSFLFYVLYLASYLGAQITYFGIGHHYFWPDSTRWNTLATHVFIDLGMISGFSFSRHFLSMRETLPRIDRILQVLIGFAVLKLALTAFLPVTLVAKASNLLFASSLVLVVAGVLGWRQGYRPARYFTGAWLFLVGGLVVHSATSSGILSTYTWTHWATAIGASIEAILLSLALGYRITILEEEKRRAEQLALIDPLSGLLNRRALAECAARELSRARRDGSTLSVFMADIDHFKQVNDEHGHETGDRAIRHVADILRESVRDMDVVARIGGEEFVVLMPATSLDGAEALAERVRERLSRSPLSAVGKSLPLRISVGVSACTRSEESLEAALGRADHALYAAKQAGRNRVMVEPPPAPQ